MKLRFTLLFATLFSLKMLAQSGPGGVSNSTSNLIWLDASAIATATANNAPISTWSDLSGNNNHFTQATPSKKPTYKKSDVNSKPSVSFSSQALTATTNITGHDKTVFFVAKASGGNNRLIAEFEKFRLYTRYISTIPNFVYTSSKFSVESSGQNIGSTASIIGSVSSTASSNVDLYVNHNKTTATRTASTYNFTSTTLGANSTSVIQYSGTVSEMIVYNGQLHSAGITIINNYLSSKYNIAISTDKYAYDGPSANRERVFGIGRDNALSLNDDAQGNGIVRINNPSSLDDGDYMLIGDNGAPLQGIATENPALVNSRYAREWRVDKTGDAGSVTLTFDISANSFGNSNNYVLLRDADGDFTNATVGVDVAAIGGFVTFNAIDFADGEFFTLGNKGVIETVQDGSWQNPNTWSCSCVPTLNSGPIFIRAGHDVTIDDITSTSTSDLTLDATSTLSFTGDYPFTIYSNLVNNGTIYTNSTGTTVFNGNIAQTIGGANSIEFNNITISNPLGLSLLTDASFIGTLQITTGTFSAGTKTMTLLSNITKTGCIAQAPTLTGTHISGNFIIQRYVPAGNAYWDYLSSPVVSSTLQDWDNELIMSVPGGADGSAFGGTLQFSVKTYSESANTSTNVTTITQSLGSCQGFQVFLGDNLTTFAARTFDTRGVPNQASNFRWLSFTDATKGYNVVGNPYACNVNWANVLSKSSNLKNEYYIYDKTIKNFAVWNGVTGIGTGNLASSGGIIPSSQGFMVRATAAPTNIVFWESDKTTTTVVWTKPAKQAFAIDFNIHEKNNIFGGQVKLLSSNYATDVVDSLDVGYVENDFDEESPNIYFETEDNKMLMNLISKNGNEKHLDLFVKANRANSLVLNSDIVSNDENYSCIYLEDKSNNKIVDLTQTGNYEFDIADKNERKQFTLHLYKANQNCDANQALSIKNTESLSNVFFINSDESVGMILNAKSSETAIISVTNVIGQEVISTQTKQISEPTKVLLNLPATNTMYIIKVQLGNKIYTNKVIR